MEAKLKHGSKSQRNLAQRTQELKKAVATLLYDYEKETGIVIDTMTVKTDYYISPTKVISLNAAIPTFEDDE